jgi:hypothetical protein
MLDKETLQHNKVIQNVWRQYNTIKKHFSFGAAPSPKLK